VRVVSEVNREKLLKWIDGEWYDDQIMGIAESLKGTSWVRDMILNAWDRIDSDTLMEVAGMVCGTDAPRDRAMEIIHDSTTEDIVKAATSECYIDEEDMMADFNSWLGLPDESTAWIGISRIYGEEI